MLVCYRALSPPCLGCTLIQGIQAAGLGYVCYEIWQSEMALRYLLRESMVPPLYDCF